MRRSPYTIAALLQPSDVVGENFRFHLFCDIGAIAAAGVVEMLALAKEAGVNPDQAPALVNWNLNDVCS